MRDISNKEQTVLVNVRDPFSDDVHIFEVRVPTAREVAEYLGKMFRRDRKRIASQAFEHNADYATKILVGIRSKTLMYNGETLSSDPGDPGYREDWKQILYSSVPELLAPIGNRFYAGASIDAENEESPLD